MAKAPTGGAIMGGWGPGDGHISPEAGERFSLIEKIKELKAENQALLEYIETLEAQIRQQRAC